MPEEQTDTSNTEETSSVDESQEETTVVNDAQEESVDQEEQEVQEVQEDGNPSAEDGERAEPQKTKEDYIRERQERREMKREALRRAQLEANEQLDPSDWEQRVQAIENERFVEKVENNISNAQRDIQEAQKLDVFANDPELFTDIMRDAVEAYGVFHDTLREVDGSPAFLGFYDPKTGAPISILSLAQREAKRFERISSRVTTQAKTEAANNEAKMRARADTPNGGGKNTPQPFESLSASQMRKILIKRGYDIK